MRVDDLDRDVVNGLSRKVDRLAWQLYTTRLLAVAALALALVLPLAALVIVYDITGT